MDAKTRIGRQLRELRESRSLSQEQVAERSGITYQYLSAVENGRENFTVGVLEAVTEVLGVKLPVLVSGAFANQVATQEFPVINRAFLRKGVPLPPNLTSKHIEAALNDTQRIVRLLNATLLEAGSRPLPSYIQGNNFSGIVSNILCDCFDLLTPYKHNSHHRYPDLVCRDAKGKTVAGLEIKSTIKAGKGGESHNGHSGWHLIACFEVTQKTGDVLFTHVMLAPLKGHNEKDSDWKYLGSKVNAITGSQRTETYTTTLKGNTKLRDGSVYLDASRISFKRWKQERDEPVQRHSIFYTS